MSGNEAVSRRRFLSAVAAVSGAKVLPCVTHGPSETTASAATGPFERVHAKAPGLARPFDMEDVRLLPGMWADVMELNRSYLYSLPNDRLAHMFRVTAGLPSSAAPLGGWEAPDCELRGHYVGHYLSACALTYASTGDTFLRDKAVALVEQLAVCQQSDGYLGAYPVIFYDRLRNNQKVWAPFYAFHKILAGHLDIYTYTGSSRALRTATRMADWADAYSRQFDEAHWQKLLLVEQGGMNEAAFHLYAITGNSKYRDLGFRFEHKKIFDPLAAGEDKLAGNHANTNIPKILGAARGYELTGDERYGRISQYFYEQVVAQHTYCTGGTSNGEFWQEPGAVASQLGPAAEECCCSYNMMKLARHLFARQPEAHYFDYYERLLFNVRLGTQDRNGMLMYYVPLQPGLYKTFGTPFDAFWCCTGTGCEEYAKLTNSIYYREGNALFVNLFMASTLHWKERGLKLRQKTTFPLEEKTTLIIDQVPSQAITIKLRVPYWATAGATVKINGQPEQIDAQASSYAVLQRAWKQGDTIVMEMPMSLHVASAPDDHSVEAAMYGPLVLATRLGTNKLTTSMIYGGSGPDEDDKGLPMPEVGGQRAASLWVEKVTGTREYPLLFKAVTKEEPLMLVPLYQVMDERYSVYLKTASHKA